MTGVTVTTPILTARGLTGPRGLDIIQDVDLSVEAGRLVHIHGASGSGKTTLLRLLARMDPTTHGALYLQARPAKDVDARNWRRRVSLVFQEARLFPGTIADNLRWGARQHGLDVDPEALLHGVGLDLSPERDTSDISGGEAKRVAIARALAVQPDVLMLDEPTGPLDAANREVLRELVRRLMHDHGLAVILVSHLQEDLTALPGEALVLDHGRIVDHGPSKDLAHRLAEAATVEGSP